MSLNPTHPLLRPGQKARGWHFAGHVECLMSEQVTRLLQTENKVPDFSFPILSVLSCLFLSHPTSVKKRPLGPV